MRLSKSVNCNNRSKQLAAFCYILTVQNILGDFSNSKKKIENIPKFPLNSPPKICNKIKEKSSKNKIIAS